MKNQDFGDSNDYLKYVILRTLLSGGSLRLSVNWMRTAAIEAAASPRTYLDDNDKWKKLDPDLYVALKSLLGPDVTPKLALIESSGLLPRATFFSKLCPDGSHDRANWGVEMIGSCAGADLVFIDPDNGIETPAKIPGSKNSSKYALWSEIERLWLKGASLLIQQHFPREDRDLFATRIAAELKQRTGASDVLVFRTSQTMFLLAVQNRHQAAIRRGLSTQATRWGTRITTH